MSGTGEKVSATTKTPADFLKSIRGRPVVVKLNSGVDYRGYFMPLLHLTLFHYEAGEAVNTNQLFIHGRYPGLSRWIYEHSNGANRRIRQWAIKNKYGDAFIRGNNVLYISTTKRTSGEGA